MAKTKKPKSALYKLSKIEKDSPKTIDFLYKKYGGRCFYCGCSTSLRAKSKNQHRATIDHVVPRSEGGGNSIDNKVLACDHCNSHKGSLSAQDFEIIRSLNLGRKIHWVWGEMFGGLNHAEYMVIESLKNRRKGDPRCLMSSQKFWKSFLTEY